MRQNLDHEVRDIYKLDKRSARVWALIRNELSPENIELFEKYETDMINLGIAKATRIKHLQVLLTISRKTNKNWIDVTKSDIDRLVKEIIHWKTYVVRNWRMNNPKTEQNGIQLFCLS